LRNTGDAVAKITTLFWDIGGVVLTNGWDHVSRKEAANTFGLDWDEFRERHDLTFPAFDSGLITLIEYLDRTIFFRPRTFTRDEFTVFMFAQSKEYPEVRAILDKVTASGKYYIGAINRVGTEAPWNIGEFYGQSYFCNPRGQIMVQASRDKDEVVVADLDLDMIQEVRNVWQFYRDRRPESYVKIATA
jgi:hypothetical protein